MLNGKLEKGGIGGIVTRVVGGATEMDCSVVDFYIDGERPIRHL
jgi:hypothetical protein